MKGVLEILFSAVTVLLFVFCTSLDALGATDIEFLTRLNIGSRMGYFSAAYISDGESLDEPDVRLISAQFFVGPGAILMLSSRRTLFQMGYQLELSNRLRMEDQFTLNFLHRPEARLQTRLSRISSFETGASARMGLLDFTSSMQDNIAQEDLSANLSNVRFVSVTATTQLTSQLNHASSVSFIETYDNYIPYGYEFGQMPPISNQHNNEFQVVYLRQLTRRALIRAAISESLVINTPGPDFVSTRVNSTLGKALSEHADLQIVIGIMMAQQLELDHESIDNQRTERGIQMMYWLPESSIICNGRINLKHKRVFTIGITALTDGYFHRATASVRQRVFFGIHGILGLTHSWNIRIRGMASTLLTPKSFGEFPEIVVPSIEYPATAVIDLSAQYTVSREFSFDFGVTSNARWANWFGDSDFRARAFEEFFLYINLTAAKNHRD